MDWDGEFLLDKTKPDGVIEKNSGWNSWSTNIKLESRSRLNFRD